MGLTEQILKAASDLHPDFNDYLLLKFRPDKISEIVTYLDAHFKESVKIFNGQLKYVGYEELNPLERLEYIKSNPIYQRQMEIQRSTFKLVKFNYEFSGQIYSQYLHIPYMDHGCIYLSDTKYFPRLPIVERGGLHRTNNSVIIKVMKAPLSFKRSLQQIFITTRKVGFKENVITAKIHQKSRKGKKNDRTPLILYHLVLYGFEKTMILYKFLPTEISIIDRDENIPEYSYICVRDDVYVKVKSTCLDDLYKRRVVASLIAIFDEYKKFSIRDIYNPCAYYFKTALGKYTYPNNNNGQLLYDNAEKHLQTTQYMLDPPAKYQLASIGIEVNDIYDLLYHVFYSIDKWIIEYNPTNLFDKKIGSLDQIMAGVVRDLNTKQYGVINKRNEGLKEETVKSFVASSSQGESWIKNSTIFRANPSIFNDNALFSVLCKRFRSLENAETKTSARKTKTDMPVYLLVGHHSQLVVESILSLPPSSQYRGPLSCERY